MSANSVADRITINMIVISLLGKEQYNCFHVSMDKNASKSAYNEVLSLLIKSGANFTACPNTLTITAKENSVKFIHDPVGLTFGEVAIDEEVPEDIVKEIKARKKT